MSRILPVVVLLFVGTHLCRAETVSFEQAGARKAAARVRNWFSGYQQGPLCNGTGTLVSVEQGHGVVLTAAHLFAEAIGPITVEFFDGQISGATLLALDKRLDVAALWIYAPRGIDPLPMANESPKLGEQLEIWGYGPERFRSFLAVRAKPIPFFADQPGSLLGAQGVENHQVTIPGDSGGAVVWHGRLVGMHWGYRGAEDDPRRCVHAVNARQLRSWLDSRLNASAPSAPLGTLANVHHEIEPR
ncbi:MAG TPA: serine protease [Pirellulales bacterium]|jgi:hypothetical protein|nr:serine protease [Pirellulales bacterium]